MISSKLGEKYAAQAVREAMASIGAVGVIKVMREEAHEACQRATNAEAAENYRTLSNRLWHAQQMLEAQ